MNDETKDTQGTGGGYLWDRSDPPDPTTAELERQLGRFAHDGRPLAATSSVRGRRPRWVWLATAAALILVCVWAFTPTAPLPRPESFHVFIPATKTVLAPGGSFVASADNRVLELGAVGRIELDVGSRIEVVRANSREAHLRLRVGHMHATVAPDLVAPRFFQVDTPSALCVDLGCEYDLDVDKRGNAHVVVTLGEVAFEHDGRDVLVPSGAQCRAHTSRGLGTPHFTDIEPRFAKLIEELDRERDATRRQDVGRKLAFSLDRFRDTLTLWHLLRDTDADVAATAAEALIRLVGHPDGKQVKGAPPVDVATWREFLRPHW